MENTSTIPKVIHYCWFGGNPLPSLVKKCIASWKKHFPDYEIKEWNETNFDINMIKYTQQAYDAKRYAFVSDYARIWILYNYGGVYLDTDVEVIRNFDDVLKQGTFLGMEKQEDGGVAVNLGLCAGCPSGMQIFKEFLETYENEFFLDSKGRQNLKTIVTRVTDILKMKGFTESNTIQKVDGITIYPAEYFSPKDFASGRLDITKNTKSIHWYDASWQPKSSKIFYALMRKIPPPVRSKLKSALKTLRGVAK